MGWLTDYGHTMAKSLLLCGPNSNSIQIQIPIPNKYLVFGYKAFVFYRNNSRLMENRSNGKHEQGTHSTKMGADKLAENTPNAPKFICPKLSTQEQKFGLHWASVAQWSFNPP